MQGQFRSKDREPAVAGTFYPSDKDTLKRDLSILFKNAGRTEQGCHVRSIISPHAGYIFSGSTAAKAFSSIDPEYLYKNIFIIGSSHREHFDGASVYTSGDFITPLGRAKVNREIGNKLIETSDKFSNNEDAHRLEHSLEVQIPFIQFWFKKEISIVPIIIGTDKTETLKEISDVLSRWFVEDNLFIISSDFSHYPAYDDAVTIDNTTAEAILSGDPEVFLTTLRNNREKKTGGLATSMCGWTSAFILLNMSHGKTGLSFKKTAYSNSGDSSYGNKYEVVGYNAIVLTERNTSASEKITESDSIISFSNDEKRILLSIARESILAVLTNSNTEVIENESLSTGIKQQLGAFVTLKYENRLRGCVGRFMPSAPLFKVVADMAVSAAFEDTRFAPLSTDEFNHISIEISVLSPFKKIEDINEIVTGKHGIYIKKGVNSGTMLPQVAPEQGWDMYELLGHTSRDKAGLGWSGWKDAEIYIYEAYIIKEEE